MSALSAVPRQPDEASRRLLAEAMRHHHAGEVDQAIALYERLLKFVPDLALAHANLGVALRARGRLEEAEARYRRALTLWPGTPDILFNLANLKRDQGKLADAAEDYRAVLATDPAHAASRTNLDSCFVSSVILKKRMPNSLRLRLASRTGRNLSSTLDWL